MKKVLVYVDAENVNVAEVQTVVSETKLRNDKENIILGKFYGNANISHEVLQLCYEIGFEYVPTTVFSTGQKNITDHKIGIDCMYDVLQLYPNDVSLICIISRDVDFTPLVYKLRSCGIEVSVPLFDIRNRHSTVADVISALTAADYNPLFGGVEALQNQFDTIRGILPSSFSDDLIEDFLLKKKKKYLKKIRPWITIERFDVLAQMDAKTFCFYDSIDEESDSALISVMIDTYVTTFYGFSFNKNNLQSITQEVCYAYS